MSVARLLRCLRPRRNTEHWAYGLKIEPLLKDDLPRYIYLMENQPIEYIGVMASQRSQNKNYSTKINDLDVICSSALNDIFIYAIIKSNLQNHLCLFFVHDTRYIKPYGVTKHNGPLLESFFLRIQNTAYRRVQSCSFKPTGIL